MTGQKSAQRAANRESAAGESRRGAQNIALPRAADRTAFFA